MISYARAHAIFREELALFARAFPHVKGTRFEIRKRHFMPASKRTARDLAWHRGDTRTVYVIEAALRRSEGTFRGVIRHELGHASDLSDAPGAEARADRLARKATGSPIRYTREGLQHATHGTPRRPRWLHQ